MNLTIGMGMGTVARGTVWDGCKYSFPGSWLAIVLVILYM